MTDARYEKLQQTLDARLCELERELDLKLRAVRANNGYSGEMRAGLDTAETAAPSAVPVTHSGGLPAAHTGAARIAAARSPRSV